MGGFSHCSIAPETVVVRTEATPSSVRLPVCREDCSESAGYHFPEAWHPVCPMCHYLGISATDLGSVSGICTSASGLCIHRALSEHRERGKIRHNVLTNHFESL